MPLYVRIVSCVFYYACIRIHSTALSFAIHVFPHSNVRLDVASFGCLLFVVHKCRLRWSKTLTLRPCMLTSCMACLHLFMLRGCVYWNIFYSRCDAFQSPGLTFEGPAHFDFHLEYASFRCTCGVVFSNSLCVFPYEGSHCVFGLLSRSALKSPEVTVERAASDQRDSGPGSQKSAPGVRCTQQSIWARNKGRARASTDGVEVAIEKLHANSIGQSLAARKGGNHRAQLKQLNAPLQVKAWSLQNPCVWVSQHPFPQPRWKHAGAALF